MLSHFLRARIKRALVRQGYLLRRIGRLTYLADRFGSDKGTQFNAHLYTEIYARLFEPLREHRLTIAEIGLLRLGDKRRFGGIRSSPSAAAPSLEMWRDYFPKADIFGFDIDDFSAVKIDRCKIIRGDMSSRDDLAKFVGAIGNPIDILIDDGSHTSHHQQIAFGYLFNYIRSGGIYVIEDLNWQDESKENSNAPKTRDVLRRFQLDGLIVSPFFLPEEQAYVQKNVRKVYLFDSAQPIQDPTDALGVIIKK
jgi:hypothetical protein